MAYNLLESLKNRGACRELKGTVGLCFVFIDEPGFVWSETDKASMRSTIETVAKYLINEAARDGVKLELKLMEDKISMSDKGTRDQHVHAGRVYAGIKGRSSLAEVAEWISNNYGCPQTAFLFLLRETGRSYASTSGSDHGDEFNVIYGINAGTVMHELLHLFGAADLYYPAEVKKLAKKLFPKSVMLSSYDGPEIDDLTRYLIGWRSAPSVEAKLLLLRVGSITEAEFDRRNHQQWDAAFIEYEFDYGTYYGPIRNGRFNGRGRLVYNDGTVFEGTFVDNSPERGTLRTKDGTVMNVIFVNGRFQKV